MGKHKIIKSAAAVALTASVVATAAPGASAASYKTNAKDQLVHTSTGKLVKGWKVFGGKLYKNGKLAPAKKYKIIGTGAAQKLFYGPTLKKGYKTANSKSLLFKDGKLADGWKQAGKNERLYKNGKLDKGYTVYTNVEGDKFLYQNGKLKKGQKTATRGGETLLFVDGKLAKGYVLHEASKTLFNNGKVAEGLVKYPETDGKFYNDGKLANGEINGATYKDGVLVAKDVASVKAINDTTVEVTFKEAQKAENIKAGDFKIEGLTISNAALKQTDDKVVVLTTSKQEAGKEYTAVYKEVDTKTFVGFNAALPTAIASTTIKPYQTSQQSIIGKEVTVKASVSVAEGANKAGIPVTFVIDSEADKAGGQFGKDQTVEVFTDENGVASYTYTQYQGGTTDTVTAYPTGAPTQRTSTNVFWGVAQPLTVSEVTTGDTLANSAKKVYKVSTSKYQVEPKGTANADKKYVNVTFAENYEVTPENVNRKATVDGKTPFQTQVAGQVGPQEAVKVYLDEKGEATFTVTGADTSVTPVVFVDTNNNDRLAQTELQATAPTVKFENIKTVGLTNQAQGTQRAAAGVDADFTGDMAVNQGGRGFLAILADKDGKLATAGTTVYLTFSDEEEKAGAIKGKLHVFDANGKKVTAENGVYKLATNAKGEVQYYVASSVTNNYATPVVFLENGSKAGLDSSDTQAKAEITYFGDATVSKATLKADKKDVTPGVTINKAKSTTVAYQTVDQNGFAYAPGKPVKVTFNVDTTFGNLTVTANKKDENGNVVKDENGNVVTEVVATATGNTNNKSFEVVTNANGYVEFNLATDRDTTVNLSASGSQTIIDNVAGKIIFTNVPTGTDSALPTDKVITAEVAAFDKAANTIKLTGYETTNFDGKKFTNAQAQTIDQDTFEKLVGDALAAGKKVEVTYDYNNGTVTYGIVSLDGTTKPSTDSAELTAFKEAVAKVPAAADVKAEDKAAIEAARAAFDALSADEKTAQAAEETKLKAAEEALKALEGEKVENSIKALIDAQAATSTEVAGFKGSFTVTVEIAKLPGELKDQTNLNLVIGDKTVAFAKHPTKDGIYYVTVQNQTAEAVNAATVELAK